MGIKTDIRRKMEDLHLPGMDNEDMLDFLLCYSAYVQETLPMCGLVKMLPPIEYLETRYLEPIIEERDENQTKNPTTK